MRSGVVRAVLLRRSLYLWFKPKVFRREGNSFSSERFIFFSLLIDISFYTRDT